MENYKFAAARSQTNAVHAGEGTSTVWAWDGHGDRAHQHVHIFFDEEMKLWAEGKSKAYSTRAYGNPRWRPPNRKLPRSKARKPRSSPLPVWLQIPARCSVR